MRDIFATPISVSPISYIALTRYSQQVIQMHTLSTTKQNAMHFSLKSVCVIQ